ncbi:hypothetical protein GEMRC1_000717 [Eukaryota sp. GEM-RC1]
MSLHLLDKLQELEFYVTSFLPVHNASCNTVPIEHVPMFFRRLEDCDPQSVFRLFITHYNATVSSLKVHPDSVSEFFWMSGTNKKRSCTRHILQKKLKKGLDEPGEPCLHLKVVFSNISISKYRTFIESRQNRILEDEIVTVDELIHIHSANWSADDHTWETFANLCNHGRANKQTIPLELFDYSSKIIVDFDQHSSVVLHDLVGEVTQFLQRRMAVMVADVYDTLNTMRTLLICDTERKILLFGSRNSSQANFSEAALQRFREIEDAEDWAHQTSSDDD